MKRLFTTLFFVLLASVSLGADRGSHDPFLLQLHGGAGYGIYRDLGASPLTYRGFELTPGISVEWCRRSWSYEALLYAEGGAYGLRARIDYLHTYGGHPLLGFAMCRLFETGRNWNFRAGASLVELFDIRYNSTLGNASMGFGNFFMLNCEGGVEYRLPKWLFHAKMQLNALSLDMRPGFAYMDNFDQDISSPTANTFDQYHWYLAAATGVSTDVGAAYLLSNGNRLGVSYRWGYFTSRHTTSCPHSFEYAHHAILFHLGFALR